jgi:hypothetical protein
LTRGARYLWDGNSSDARALRSPDGSGRRAATYYDGDQIGVRLDFTAAYNGNLNLYALDLDSRGRRETISVDDGSGSVRPVYLGSDFTPGAWVSVPINVGAGGSVRITVDRTAGANAVLSGVFLGGAGPPAAPPVSSSPQGNWVGTFGSDGYVLGAWNGSTDLANLPNGSATLTRGARYVWDGNSSDARALQAPDKSSRRATTYYDGDELRLLLSFNAAYAGILHLYAFDLDSRGRRETIFVDDGSGTVRPAYLSSDFTPGAWVPLPINVGAGGSVSITVDRTAGANAVLSGVFLG